MTADWLAGESACPTENVNPCTPMWGRRFRLPHMTFGGTVAFRFQKPLQRPILHRAQHSAQPHENTPLREGHVG